MQKTVTLQCADCGDKISFKIGADKSMATLGDVAAMMEESKERDKVLEWMVKSTNTQPDDKLVTLFDNMAEPLCNVNYQALGGKTKLFDASVDDDPAVKRFKSPDLLDKLNSSMLKWLDALKKDGVVAFYGMFYCKKCKKLSNRIYLRIHTTNGGKEFLYVYPNKCETCKNDLELVDEDNMGFVYAGLPTALMCKCGKPYTVDGVNFAWKQQEKKV